MSVECESTVLFSYGARQREFDAANAAPALSLARVVSQSRTLYRVVTESSTCFAEVSGRYRHEADAPADYPAVGDFVLCDRPDDGAGNVQIVRLLPRRSVLTRMSAGTQFSAQVVAANVDTLFICMALNSDYNKSRLERYLSVAWSSGATPVVLLTKADLCEDLSERLLETEQIAPGADVLAVSNTSLDCCAPLRRYLIRGMTASFVGSSGVGKSTLINLLLGENRLETGDVREDGKGRHTTTRRELMLLPDGGVVIDTPGMRELGVESAELTSAFADVDALAAQCRFADCTHTNEPGCAVCAAIESGALSPRRLESYRKLAREMRYEGMAARELENAKLEMMFSDVGGMKNVRRYIRSTDKRR